MPVYRYSSTTVEALRQACEFHNRPSNYLGSDQGVDAVIDSLLELPNWEMRLGQLGLPEAYLGRNTVETLRPVMVPTADRYPDLRSCTLQQFDAVVAEARRLDITVSAPIGVFDANYSYLQVLIAGAQARAAAAATVTAPKAHDLTFGIEIECYIPEANARGINVGNYHAGIQVEGLPAGWNAQRDGSVGYKAGYLGFELVSPKLQGQVGIEQVKLVADWLKAKGAKVYKNCGFHMHVGLGRWKTNENLNKLVMLAKYWDKAMYAVTGTVSREQGHYCKTYLPDDVNRITRMTLQEKQRISDKYRLLNLTPLSRQGTVEWRVFSGTVNKTKMLAYIQLGLGLCEAACGPISMASLKMAPSGKLASEIANGRVQGIVRELIRFVWRVPARPDNSKARGVLDPESIPACCKELRRLAKEYQKKSLEGIE